MSEPHGVFGPGRRFLLAAFLACNLPFSSCKFAKQPASRRVTSISLDKATFTLGEEIRIRPGRLPGNWSGEATVNTFRARLPIDSKNNAIKATRENGFTTLSPTEICVTLKDETGKDIPVANQCVRVSVTEPDVRLSPESDAISASGGAGRIRIQAPPDRECPIGGVPDWITVTRDNKEALGPMVLYKVAENTSYKLRSATIKIGDASFELTQWGSPFAAIPYSADFTQPPIPVWEMPEAELRTGKSHDAPPQWILDNQPGIDATVQTSKDAPDGKGALVVEQDVPADEIWKTLLFLPGIQTQGGRYMASVWLKAENPVSVGLEFGQRTTPYKNCGLFHLVNVTKTWQQFKFPFTPAGVSCGAENNRFSINCGTVSGKLWISGFSLTRLTREQWVSPYVRIPYSANFTEPPIPVWEMAEAELRTGKLRDAPPQWILDNQPGENATVQISADGPDGKGVLIVERSLPADEIWKTLIFLPGIQTEGGSLTVSVRMKADNPVSVGLEFGQRTAPYKNCGLFHLVSVTETWQQFKFPFTPAGASCGPENNRFSIHSGKVSGKLWVSDFSLTKE